MEDLALPAAPPAPTLSFTLLAAAAAVAEAMEEALGAALPPLTAPVPAPGDDSACGSPCSVASDCSSVASADFEGFAELGTSLLAGPAVLFDDLTAASVAVAEAAEPRAVGATARSVFAMDCVPLWGLESICGRRPEMEDDYAVVPRFFDLPLWMVAGDAAVDGLDRASFRLPAHFFAVYDGHGGVQVPFAFVFASSQSQHIKRIQHTDDNLFSMLSSVAGCQLLQEEDPRRTDRGAA
jgi:protein phosphatase 2C